MKLKFEKVQSLKGVGFIALILFSVVLFALNLAYAYFTATANKNGELTFGEISLEVQDSSANTMTDASFLSAYVGVLEPGKLLNFDGIKIKNIGSADCYSIINLNFTATGLDGEILEYDYWYNLSGAKINVNNLENNTTTATSIAKDATVTLDLDYTIPWALDNNYLGATATVTLSTHAVQAQMPSSVTNKPLYAVTLILDALNS